MNEQQGLDPMFQENGSQWMEGGLASEPLNVYTAKTFGWMFLGLLVTFGTAIAFSAGGITCGRWAGLRYSRVPVPRSSW